MHSSSSTGARLLRALAVAALAAAPACVGNPSSDVAMAEAINEIGNELSLLRDENAVLQSQVDSLRGALARQDTLLRQVANLAGIPLTR